MSKDTLIRYAKVHNFFLESYCLLEELFPNCEVIPTHIGITSVLSCKIYNNLNFIGQVDFHAEDAIYRPGYPYGTGKVFMIQQGAPKEDIVKIANEIKMMEVLDR